MIDINAKFSLANTTMKRTNSGGLSDRLMATFLAYSQSGPVSNGLWVVQGRSYATATGYHNTQPPYNFVPTNYDTFCGNAHIVNGSTADDISAI